ncbi:MAG: TolC family protein [Bryobacterales bacterium]|nr:TolC family protein [Bryobacterales bacterium]
MNSLTISPRRRALALLLTALLAAPQLSGQQVPAIAPVPPQGNSLLRPYLAPEAPPIRLTNSPRLATLLRGGNLYLTAHDAIALALENNIDLEIARYSPILADWRVTRALAGGALPGVPSGAGQAASFASGQGVLGSQAAAGVSGGGGAGGGGAGRSNATVSQVGPVVQTLDPTFQQATTFSHRSNPQSNVTQSLTNNLVSRQRAYSGSFQQGFLTGGSVTVSYTHHFLEENSPTNLLNPSTALNASIMIQHNLLQGFGTAVNGRNIKVARLNRNISDLDFETQVTATVSSVLRAYFKLTAGDEDVRAKQDAAATAAEYLRETRERVSAGAAAGLDITAAQSQLATARRDLIISRTTFGQDETQLKNLISRNGVEDPALRDAHIITLDKLAVPDEENLPQIRDLVSKALAARADLQSQTARLETAEVSAIGTRNGLLPVAQVFAITRHSGLAGVRRQVPRAGGFETSDPFFAGGVGTALGQVFRRNYPTEGAGVFFRNVFGNNQAQADYAIDQLQLRQSQLTGARSRKQVEVDVRNAVIAIEQARARYQAARENRILAAALLEAEQKRLRLGASTPFNVVQQQRDFTIARSGEISAMAAYRNARLALEQSLGTVLQSNGITLAEAVSGKLEQPARP